MRKYSYFYEGIYEKKLGIMRRGVAQVPAVEWAVGAYRLHQDLYFVRGQIRNLWKL